MGEAVDNTVWENSDLWHLSPSRGDNLKSLGDKDKVLSVFTNIMECHQIISWSTQHWWLNIVRVDWALWTWFIYVCVYRFEMTPSLSVCLAYVLMRFPCMSAVDFINIYIALNVVIQSWQIYYIRMKTEFLMNSIWSQSGNSIYTL